MEIDFHGGLLTLRAKQVTYDTLLQKLAETAGYQFMGATADETIPVDLTVSAQPFPMVLKSLIGADKILLAVPAARAEAVFAPQLWMVARRIIEPVQEDKEVLPALVDFSQFSTERKLLCIDRLTASNMAQREELLSLFTADPDPAVRHHALWALRRLATPASQQGLEAGLGDQDYLNRIAVVQALASLPEEQALPTLGQVLYSDADPLVRLEAVYALGRLVDRGGQAFLQVATADTDPMVRQVATESLKLVDRESSDITQ